jgi:hypothetical protein
VRVGEVFAQQVPIVRVIAPDGIEAARHEWCRHLSGDLHVERDLSVARIRSAPARLGNTVLRIGEAGAPESVLSSNKPSLTILAFSTMTMQTWPSRSVPERRSTLVGYSGSTTSGKGSDVVRPAYRGKQGIAVYRLFLYWSANYLASNGPYRPNPCVKRAGYRYRRNLSVAARTSEAQQSTQCRLPGVTAGLDPKEIFAPDLCKV